MKLDYVFKLIGSRRTWTPYVVLVGMLLLTGIASYYVAITAKAKDMLRFENEVQRTQKSIQNRLGTYITLLRTGSGLFAASQTVTQKDFRAYVNRLDLQRNYPGIQGIGFTVRVKGNEKDALVAEMLAQGVKNFTVKPGFNRSEYHAIIYLEPLDRRNKAAIGYDMFIEPKRRAAMERARDTDQPAASAKVRLVQEIDPQKQAGFLIYVPVYRQGPTPKTVAQRRAALRGFVYSPYRVEDFLRGMLSGEELAYVDFQIYDGTEIDPKNLLHRSQNKPISHRLFYRSSYRTIDTIYIAGRPWTIVFTSRPELHQASEIRLVPYIALFGGLLGFILFAVIRAQVRARAAAERSQQALRESESRLTRLVDANIIGIIIADMQGNIIETNDAFLSIVGYSRSEAMSGQINWWEITPPEYRHLDEQAIEEMKRTGSHPPFEKEYIRKDGDRVPVLVGTAYLGGSPELGVGFLIDLTEQKRAEQSVRISETRFRTLIEQSPFSTQILSPDGRTIQVNKAWEELWGIKLEKIRHYNILQDEQLVEKGIMPYIQRAFAGEATAIPPILYDPNQSIPGITVHEDPRRWVQAIAYPVKDEAGNIREVVILHEDITIRKRAEDALKESEYRYSQILDSVQDMVFCKAPGSLIVYANKAACDYYGMTAEQLRGITDVPFNQVDYTQQYLRDDLQVFTTGESLEVLEEPNIRADGEIRFFHTIKTPIFDINGNVVQIVGVSRDITERKQADEALRRSEERFRRLFDSNLIGVAFWNMDGYITDANEAYLRILGYTPEEFASLGQISWKHLTPPEYKDADDRAIADCMANGVSDVFEKEYIRRDGVRVPVVLGIAGIDDSQYHGVAFVLNITDRKKAEQALKDSEERFRHLAEKVRLIPWEADPISGNFTYVGPQTVEILGYPLENWYADNFWEERIHPEDRKWAIEFCANSTAYLDNYDFEYRMLAANGEVVWLYDLVNVVRDENGPKLLRGIMIDITDRKQVEAERIQLLEREQAARAQAEAANRMKDEFLATLSHELRTPLNAMVGWTTLLRTRKFDEVTTDRALETIDRNTKALSQLIEDLLDVSRIMTGKFRIEMRPVNLAGAIENAIEAVRSAADAKNIQINYVTEEKFCLVSGDHTRLQQIVWNLISNAIKFTPKEGQVEVRLERNEYDASIIISDTGQGISPEFLPYIFERFRQADASITRKHGGLGLGLAIVRHLVELHGGFIHAASLGEGQGSTFTVTLPMRAVLDFDEFTQTNLPANLRDISNNDEPPKTPTQLNNLWVLVVDDEPDARELIRTVLEESGAKVTAVGSAQEAFEIIAEADGTGRPDILISDIGMPGEDGYSLIGKIRKLAPGKGGNIPALALTAYARKEERERAIAAGFQIHVAKPVVPEDLLAMVANLCNP